MWSLEQMLGLSRGLEDLHDLNCRHGDLKPDNILHFIKDGRDILVIADLGVSKFHIHPYGSEDGEDNDTSHYCCVRGACKLTKRKRRQTSVAEVRYMVPGVHISGICRLDSLRLRRGHQVQTCQRASSFQLLPYRP